MAWTSPYTYTVNLLVDHTNLNTYVSDNLQYLYDNRFTAALFGVSPLVGRCSVDLTCTTSYQDVAGCSVTLGGTGDYVLIGIFHIAFSSVSGTHAITGRLLANDVAQAANIRANCIAGAENAQAPVGQLWKYTAASAGLVAKLQATSISNYSDLIKTPGSVLLAFQVGAP